MSGPGDRTKPTSAAGYGEGETRFDGHMTDAEALMWNVEKDPWMSSTMGTVLVTEEPIDAAEFRRKVAWAVAEIPRLRERVVPTLGRFTPPQWRPDPDFDLDFHLRHLALPQPGSERQLLDLCSYLLSDPFDRTRPLWQFVVIDGVTGGRGALLVKLHHTLTDGMGAVRLAERYMDIGPTVAAPTVDLDAIVAAAAAEAHGAEHVDEFTHAGGLDPGAVGAATLQTAAQAAQRQFGFVRRAVGEAMLLAADPARVPELGRHAAEVVKVASRQLGPSSASSSSLWAHRSRRRHLEVLRLPFRPCRDAASALGGTLNDFFVTGAVAGAAAYHEAHHRPLEHLTVTFVVSTRNDDSAGGNAFTPSKAELPAGPMTPRARFGAVHETLAARRSEVGGGGLLSSVAGAANLLPTSVVTRIARSQARGVDFATSNVRAAPFDVYLGGARVVETYPVGPVAGTACNVTLMSYSGGLYLGLNIDPVAVTDPAGLARCMDGAYRELLDAAGLGGRGGAGDGARGGDSGRGGAGDGARGGDSARGGDGAPAPAGRARSTRSPKPAAGRTRANKSGVSKRGS